MKSDAKTKKKPEEPTNSLDQEIDAALEPLRKAIASAKKAKRTGRDLKLRMTPCRN